MNQFLACPFCTSSNIKINNNIATCENCSYMWKNNNFLSLPILDNHQVYNTYIGIDKVNKKTRIRYRNRHIIKSLFNNYEEQIISRGSKQKYRIHKHLNQKNSFQNSLQKDDLVSEIYANTHHHMKTNSLTSEKRKTKRVKNKSTSIDRSKYLPNNQPILSYNDYTQQKSSTHGYDISKIKTTNTSKYINKNEIKNIENFERKNQVSSSYNKERTHNRKIKKDDSKHQLPSSSKNPVLTFFANLNINYSEDKEEINNQLSKQNSFQKQSSNRQKLFDYFINSVNYKKIVTYSFIFIIISSFIYLMPKMSLTQNNKDKELRQNKVESIPNDKTLSIDNSSSITNASKGISDSLVIGDMGSDIDTKEDSFTITKEEEQSPVEVLMDDQGSTETNSTNNNINSTLPNNDNNSFFKNKWLNKTILSLRQTANNLVRNVQLEVYNSNWVNDYFEINLNIINKSSNKSYIIKALEVIILDSSNNVVNNKIIYSNTLVKSNGKKNLTLRIPNSPNISARSYVNIKEIIEK